jgi:hypothetical protein
MAYHVTRKGYVRSNASGRFQHVEVWEQQHGRPVPDGHDVHHINGTKTDNSPDNLRAVTKLEHKRIHPGCELRDGWWWKPCTLCGEFKPVTAEHWYISGEGWPLYGRCRPCHIARVVSDKRLRKVRRSLAA